VPFRQTTFWRGLEKNLVGHLLAGTRAKLRLSQTKAAALAGIPQSLLSAYETGRKRLTHKAAEKLGHAWGDDSLPDVLRAEMLR
jgi:transcriptional regulator with XRE-family HTH domain